MYNFHLINIDTDSLTICKADQTPFSKEEQVQFLEELNRNFPEKVRWMPDGYFPRFIVARAKNYVMLTEKGAIKKKGSALKDGKKEIALREFIEEIFKAIIEDNKNLTEIYRKYVKEALNVKDIKRWSSRKTLTSKTFSSDRDNETKLADVVEFTDYKEGDRCWVFFLEDGSLQLAEKFTGTYDKIRLVRKIHQTSKLFENILPKNLFINYSLKKNLELLEEL